MTLTRKIGQGLASLLLLAGLAGQSLGIVGAQTESSSSSQIKFVESESASSQYQEADNSVNKETFQQVEDLLKQNQQVSINAQPYYSSDQVFQADQQNFAVKVDLLRIYSVTQAAKELESEFNFDNQNGAVAIMHVSISNKTNAPIYYPIEELKLSYNEASLEVAPSYQLYPAEEGNLAQELSDQKGTIEAGQTVSGYLIFGLGGASYEHIQQDGYFYLKIVAPKRSESDITGISVNSLGDEQLLYLPAQAEAEQALKESATHIPDRLTTEYWGTKHILADDKLSVKEADQGIDVTVTRLEVSDFKPNSYNEASFRNFKYGAVIVSVEYDVTNKTQTTLLPVDGSAILTINGDPINCDYVLTNQAYGKELAPGQTYHVIRTFALDKMRYQEMWQDQPFSLEISVPEKGPVTDSASQGQEGQATEGNVEGNQVTSEQLTYSVNIELVPKLIQRLTEDLTLEPVR